MPGAKIVAAPRGAKLSERLLKILEPYPEAAATPEEMRKLLALAAAAWNVSVLPREQQDPEIRQLLSGMDRRVRRDGRRFIKELVARKEACFPDDRRTVLDFEVVDEGDSYSVSVVALMPEMPNEGVS